MTLSRVHEDLWHRLKILRQTHQFWRSRSGVSESRYSYRHLLHAGPSLPLKHHQVNCLSAARMHETPPTAVIVTPGHIRVLFQKNLVLHNAKCASRASLCTLDNENATPFPAPYKYPKPSVFKPQNSGYMVRCFWQFVFIIWM